MSRSSDIRRIYRGEIIGRYVEIVQSSDPNQRGLKGWIVDETKNTISIAIEPSWQKFMDGPINREDIRIIPKDEVKMRILSRGVDFRPEIEGPGLDDVMINLGRMKFRPEDRIKKLRRLKIEEVGERYG